MSAKKLLKELNMKKIQDINKILEAKDKRSEYINALALKNKYVVSVRANYPSANKLNAFSDYVVEFFADKINLKRKKKTKYADGLTYIFVSQTNPKLELIKLEEEHTIGRLVDIDVYTKDGSISRKEFGLKPRKCFICDDDAKNCSRSKKHNYEELINHFDSQTLKFIKKNLESMIYDSLMDELNLEHKFGLVTPSTNGIHNDMDYKLMKSSAKTIAKGLSGAVDVCLNSKSITDWGIEIEQKMLKKTGGINTHKGAIFALGLTSLCYINNILLKNYNISAYKSSKIYIDKLLDSKESVTKDLKTKGEMVVKKYKVHGAKDVARNGYSIFDCLLEEDSDHIALLKIITQIDDTTSINRAGLKKYRVFQSKCKSLLDNWDKDKLIELDNWACQNRISPGGAADLLAVWNFIKRTKLNLGELKWQLKKQQAKNKKQ